MLFNQEQQILQGHLNDEKRFGTRTPTTDLFPEITQRQADMEQKLPRTNAWGSKGLPLVGYFLPRRSASDVMKPSIS
tara:strand:+ start:85 stop:315 length:231 start_codon:yes stop_codon:yes gene_type:complete